MKDPIEVLLKLSPLIAGVLFNVVIIIVVIYIVYRSGSMEIFANKIWGIFIGEKQYFNEKLAKREQDEHDIAKFNFKTNLKIKSIKQIELLYDQLQKFDLDIKVFTGLRDRYNPNTGKIKKVKGYEMFNVILVSLLVGCFLLPFFLAVFILRPFWTFDGGQLFDLLAYTFLIAVSTVISFSELLRRIKAIKMRKVVYKKKSEYLQNRKP